MRGYTSQFFSWNLQVWVKKMLQVPVEFQTYASYEKKEKEKKKLLCDLQCNYFAN